MNPCDDKILLLNALIDGELDAANTVALEAHLKACPGCGAIATLQPMSKAPLLKEAA